MAEAHAEGKEAFARGIATELFSDFLSVEERFAANKEATEQEVIDSLRQVNPRLASRRFLILHHAVRIYLSARKPDCMRLCGVLFGGLTDGCISVWGELRGHVLSP